MKKFDSNSEKKFLQLIEKNSLDPEIRLLAFATAAAAANSQQALAFALCEGFKRKIPAEEFYEAILQTYLFAGFPAALEGLATLESVMKEKKIPFSKEIHEDFNVEFFRMRGEDLCKKIYTSAYEKVRKRVKILSPELDEWMIVEGYGKTLYRGILPIKIRELTIVSVLATLGWEKQLYSHLRGSLNVGATSAECLEVLRQVPILSSQKNFSLGKKILRELEAARA